jgi:hypothetical protein
LHNTQRNRPERADISRKTLHTSQKLHTAQPLSGPQMLRTLQKLHTPQVPRCVKPRKNCIRRNKKMLDNAPRHALQWSHNRDKVSGMVPLLSRERYRTIFNAPRRSNLLDNAARHVRYLENQQRARQSSQAHERESNMETVNSPVVVAETTEQELIRLRAENEALKVLKVAGIKGMKVSEKGALSIYGLGRFPVTLYRSQWEALLAKADDIRAFIKANEAKLKNKGE